MSFPGRSLLRDRSATSAPQHSLEGLSLLAHLRRRRQAARRERQRRQFRLDWLELWFLGLILTLAILGLLSEF